MPVVHTLQQCWPATEITWIIGKLEYALVKNLRGVEFIVFDKSRGWAAYSAIWRQLHGRRFEVLLHMQAALRASVLSLGIRAALRVGFDRVRARDFQYWFSDKKIAVHSHQHVLDGFFSFLDVLGVEEKVKQWPISIDAAARSYAAGLLGDAPTLVINPCSSRRARNFRNWRADAYAEVADYAYNHYGLRIAITGGPGFEERQMARAIADACQTDVINLVGVTTVQQLLAVLERARLVIAPDTGPTHIASALGTAVIGLYATSNPDRTGPYRHREWVVNRYPQALNFYRGKSVDEVRWGTRVRHPDAIDLIQVGDVTAMLERVMASGDFSSALESR